MLKLIIEKLIWLYILLLPLQTVFIFDEKNINGYKWQYGTGVFYATEILLVIIAILALIYLIKSKKIILSKFLDKNNLIKKTTIICLWLLITWSGLSIFWSTEKSAAIYLWLKLLEGAALFLIIISLKIKQNNLLWPLSFTAGVQGLLAAWQFITQSITENKWLGIAAHEASRLGEIVIENSDGRWLRAYGTFSHPNILGGVCVCGLLASLKLSCSVKKQYQIILMIFAITNILGIFFSFSRSAWLATIIILLIATIDNIKKRNYSTIKLIITSCLIGSFLLVTFSNLIIARNDFSNRLEKKSLNERKLQIIESLTIIKSSNWLGVGINNYTATLAMFNPQLPAYLFQPVHNLYLLILSELGIIGFLFFIAFLILFLIPIIQEKNYNQLLWFIPLLIIGCFDHYFWTQYIGIILFWLILTNIKLNIKIFT